MTEKDGLLQVKERELAEAQQQLRQQVSCMKVGDVCGWLLRCGVVIDSVGRCEYII